MPKHAQLTVRDIRGPYAQCPFPLSVTACLGNCKSAQEYLKAFETQGVEVDAEIRKFLSRGNAADSQVKCSRVEYEVDFVYVTVGELGFEEERLNRIIPRAKVEMGLDECQPEDSLALALSPILQKYKDDVLFIAMKNICPDGPRIFMLYGGMLRFVQASPFEYWARGTKFMFRKSRPMEPCR